MSSIATFARACGLTPGEAKLLITLHNANGGYVSRDILHAAVTSDRSSNFKIIRVYISRLRSKLKHRGVEIENYWGGGYRLTPKSFDFISTELRNASHVQVSNHQQHQGV